MSLSGPFRFVGGLIANFLELPFLCRQFDDLQSQCPPVEFPAILFLFPWELWAPQGNCANWHWMSLGPRGDRLCRDRIREVMFEPSFVKKGKESEGNKFGVLSLAPAIPQKQQINGPIFHTSQNRKSVRLKLHTAPIAWHGIGLRLFH